jgi:hypothetical protein
VKLVQPIDLPRPRRLEILTEPSFVALKATLLAALRQEHGPEAQEAV